MIIDAPMAKSLVPWVSSRPKSKWRRSSAAVLTAIAYLGLLPAGSTVLLPFSAFLGRGNDVRVLRGEIPLPPLAGASLALAGAVFILIVAVVVRSLRRGVLKLDLLGIALGVFLALSIGVAFLMPSNLTVLVFPACLTALGAIAVSAVGMKVFLRSLPVT